MSSRTLTDITRNASGLKLLAVVLLAALSGCSVFKKERFTLGDDGLESPAPAAPAKGKPAQPPPPTGGGGAAPERVKQRFEHAVSLMQAGNTEQAEIELRDVMLLAPQEAAPVVDLSILYRKQGKLEEAEQMLRTASSQSANAMVLTELGVTQRLRGEFRDAQSSYEKAISVDPKYAPAYRDLGVVADVYLGDAPKALQAFEHYQELAGDDKTVANWIAELRVRTGQKAAPKAADTGKAADSAKTDIAAKADAAPQGAQPAAKGAAAAADDADAPAPAAATKARKAAKPRKAPAPAKSSSSASSAPAADPAPPAKPQ